MAGGLFVLPKMHKITQNSLLKKHGIFCLTFSTIIYSIISLKNLLSLDIMYLECLVKIWYFTVLCLVLNRAS